MKAKKENKTYRITTEQEKQRYLKDGFDIYDDDGNLLEYSPSKKIAYSAYADLQKENEALKAELAAAKAAQATENVDEPDTTGDKTKATKRKGE